MNGYEYILTKQTAWAANSGIALVGSKVSRGRPAYAPELDQNLFQPLLAEVKESFESGDGGELGSPGSPGKMQAVHSSSALGVNVFQYWKSISEVPGVASACGLCRRGSQVSYDIRFEEKYPIKDNFGHHPNIDVVIYNNSKANIRRFAIECKFSEAYGTHKHGGLKPKYLEYEDIWKGLPNLRDLAERISPDDHEFKHLHVAQLLKHILGLKRHFGQNGFRLLYLWYDVFGEQGLRHRNETEEFSRIAKQDGIKFHSLTYQKLIATLAGQFRMEHEAYVRYLTERYF